MKRKTVISSASAIEPFLYFCWESFACTLNPFRQKDANAQKKNKNSIQLTTVVLYESSFGW